MKLLLLLLLSTLLGNVVAQTQRLDSLRTAVDRSSSTEQKLRSILALCEDYQSLNKDTLDKYASLAKQLAGNSNDGKTKTLAALAMANNYMRWGWMDSALATIEPELEKYSADIDSQRGIYFKLARQKALCYGASSNYKEALAILYSLANDAEKYNDSIVAGANLNSIGSVSIARDEPGQALVWLLRALNYSPATERHVVNRSAIFINMANAYYWLNRIDSAQYFIKKAIPLARQSENLNILATALRVHSKISLEAGQVMQAEATMKEMLELRKKTNDGDIVVEDNLQLANFYLNTKQFDKAIAFCREKLVTGDLYAPVDGPGKTFVNNIKNRLPYYQVLAKAYKEIGNGELYSATLEDLIAAKDSLYQESSAEALAELQTKYEVQKKENTIIQQKLDITRKNYMVYGSMILSALIILLIWIIFRNYLKKQKRMSLRAVKEAEEKERVRIAADLHDNLGAYAAAIASNLDSIKFSQDDLSGVQALEELRFNAKSIVSQLSDTIWALNKESLSLTAISDRVKLLLQRITRSYPGIAMEVKEDIRNPVSFSPSQGFHLFQIIQEAVTNAVKHSYSKKIEINIRSSNGWKILIKDEGKGMRSDINNGGGNGLFSMAARAGASGYTVGWEPNIPCGTTVSIVPTTN